MDIEEDIPRTVNFHSVKTRPDGVFCGLGKILNDLLNLISRHWLRRMGRARSSINPVTVHRVATRAQGCIAIEE